MSEPLCFQSASRLAQRLRAGELSPQELVEACLARIEEVDPALRAFVTVLPERARAAAGKAAAALRGGTAGPLEGIPVAVQDLFDPLEGVPNTFGCRVLERWVPGQSSVAVERLQRAGAIVIGKTNTSELGHKAATDNRLFGATSTPFAPGCNAGGGAGGSAAAVAAGMVPLAQGGDAGGSLRIPASFCGVVGFKPSFGRVAVASRPDAFTTAPLACTGPLARSVEDAALLLSVLAGSHPRDPFSLPDSPTDWVAATRRPVDGLRIAYSPDLDVFPVEPEVAAVVEQAVLALAGTGARVSQVSLGLQHFGHRELADLWTRQMAVMLAAMLAALKTQGLDLLGKHRDELGPELVALAERGRALRAVDSRLDDVRRTEVFDAVADLFERYDVLLLPTVSTLPFPNLPDGATLGPREVAGQRVDPLIGWALTFPFNFTGHPAASVPAGMTAGGLPVGIQIVGRRLADDVVLATAAALERARPWAALYERLTEGGRVAAVEPTPAQHEPVPVLGPLASGEPARDPARDITTAGAPLEDAAGDDAPPADPSTVDTSHAAVDEATRHDTTTNAAATDAAGVDSDNADTPLTDAIDTTDDALAGEPELDVHAAGSPAHADPAHEPDPLAAPADEVLAAAARNGHSERPAPSRAARGRTRRPRPRGTGGD